MWNLLYESIWLFIVVLLSLLIENFIVVVCFGGGRILVIVSVLFLIVSVVIIFCKDCIECDVEFGFFMEILLEDGKVGLVRFWVVMIRWDIVGGDVLERIKILLE